MSDIHPNPVVPQKLVVRIGDGINNNYTISHPLGLDVVTSAYFTETGEALGNFPERRKDGVRFVFHRTIQPDEITVVIIG